MVFLSDSKWGDGCDGGRGYDGVNQSVAACRTVPVEYDRHLVNSSSVALHVELYL